MMFKKQIYIKPLNPSEDAPWGVFEMSAVESFFDDWLRHGLTVAWGNLQTEWSLLKIKE